MVLEVLAEANEVVFARLLRILLHGVLEEGVDVEVCFFCHWGMTNRCELIENRVGFVKKSNWILRLIGRTMKK